VSHADSSLPLQKAIIDTLKADSAVAAIVGARVYDMVPAGAPKPYVSFGPEQVLPDKGDEYDGADIFVQLDGWSATGTKMEIKRLGAAIRSALDEKPLTLVDDQRLVRIAIEDAHYLVEPDGLTQHAALTFRARTEPSA
jgi:hypothetical protein